MCWRKQVFQKIPQNDNENVKRIYFQLTFGKSH